jgi:hypothetical protein
MACGYLVSVKTSRYCATVVPYCIPSCWLLQHRNQRRRQSHLWNRLNHSSASSSRVKSENIVCPSYQPIQMIETDWWRTTSKSAHEHNVSHFCLPDDTTVVIDPKHRACWASACNFAKKGLEHSTKVMTFACIQGIRVTIERITR